MSNIYISIKDKEVMFDALSVKRSWMENTFDKHAYRCLPVNLANTIGWTFYYKNDISFIWNGNNDSSNTNVKILSGNKHAHPNRGNSTISFNTSIMLKSEEDISVLIMPVPNQFIDGVSPFTAVISPSVLQTELPCAWMITKPNEIINIPAGTPIASIVPVSLKTIQSYNAVLVDSVLKNEEEHNKFLQEYGNESQKITKNGNWTDFYRNATDHFGNKIGNHELKSLRLKVIDERKNNA